MWNKVEVYTSRQNVDTLEIVDSHRPDLDYFYVKNIDGLDPVTAAISTTGLPSADLSVISGEEVPARNIVITLSPNPDWSTWTYETLRKLIYQYFTPKSRVRLVFSKGGSSDPLRPTFANMVAQNPALFLTAWIADHDFSVDIAWNPSVTTDATAILRPEGTGGNIFVAEVYAGWNTDSTEPDWSSAPSIGDYLYDGSLTWYNAGPATSFSPSPTTWSPDTEYGPTSFVWPTIPNGHLYVPLPGYVGLSGSEEPEWQIDGNYASDNDLYWVDMGMLSSEAVEIYGTVESCSYSEFTGEPEYQISILCPDPYFTAVNETIVTGTVIAPEDWPPSSPIVIGGDVPIGCKVKLPSGYTTGELFIQSGDPSISTFHLILADDIAFSNIFMMDSRPLHKAVRILAESSGQIFNLLNKLQPGYEAVWPVLKPGENLFAVMGSNVGDDWELKYLEKYAGL